MRNMLYRIENFGTLDSPSGRGGWGFNIYLDQAFAERLRNNTIEDQAKEVVTGDTENIIKRFGLDGKEIENPYGFYQGSWLISDIRVPGNSTDIALAESSKQYLETGTRTNQLEYMSHNVDSMEQASCLAALFFNWIDIADACAPQNH